MYHFFIDESQADEKEIRISGSDFNHIKHVLRMKPGEEIRVSDGNNIEYRCVLRSFSEVEAVTEVIEQLPALSELPVHIYLFQGLPKFDKMEWIIQKAVELGAYAIVPMETERSIVKIDAKKEENRRKRWNAIAESAAKQSGRNRLPEVLPLMNFSGALSFCRDFEISLIPYELAEGMNAARALIQRAAQLPFGSRIGILIGSEGGFTQREIEEAKEAGAFPLTLGRRILRTETAGMTVLSILMFAMEREHGE